MSKDLSLEQLLEFGVPLKEILDSRETPSVKVTVDTDELADTICKAAIDNKETLSQIKAIIAASNESNKNIMLKTAQMFIKQGKEQLEGKRKEIKGLKVIRDELNLISELKFIT